MEMKMKYYKVAGLTFCVQMDERLELEGRLKAYEPFETEPTENLLFTLPVLPDEDANPHTSGWELIVNSEEGGYLTELYMDDAGRYHYLSCFDWKPGMWFCVDYNRDMKDAFCRVHGDADFQLQALNNALMLMYALCSATKNTMLFHSSVVMHRGKGYMFLGKSGTGKSTHSQLWLKYIPDCELLNDDNPVVKIINGKPWVFGSPWSGKTPCYKNMEVPVGGIVRLWQAPVNEIKRLGILQAYAALLPTVSSMRWEQWCADSISASLNELIKTVPIFSLKNRPEETAARMSYKALVGEDGRD